MLPRVIEAQPCAVCSAPFTPLRPTHRYCCNTCRKLGLAAEQREKHRIPVEAVAARRRQQRERTEAALLGEFGSLSPRELKLAARIWRLAYSVGYGKAYRKEMKRIVTRDVFHPRDVAILGGDPSL